MGKYAAGLLRNPPVLLAISTIIILISLLLAGALIAYNYHQNSDIVLEIADERMVDLAAVVDERLLNIVRPLRSIADFSTAVPALVDNPHELPGAAFDYLTTVLLEFPQVYSLFLGFDDGAFFQIYHLDENDHQLREALKAPPETVFSIRSIKPKARTSTYLDTWNNIDAEGRRVSPPRSELEIYDPRTRPWYLAAIEAADTVSVGPYRFAHTGETGFTIARPFNAGRSGVLGVDVTTSSISEFLREQSLSQSGLIVIANASGEVIAHPDKRFMETASIKVDGSLDLPRLADLDDPLATELAKLFENGNRDQSISTTINGDSYIGRISPLDRDTGGDVHIGVLIPTRTFTETIEQVGQRSLLVSLALVAAAIPVIILLSRLIVRPLREIGGETEKIRRFALESPVSISSRIREVRDLLVSIDRMKSGLRNFGIYVPKALVRQMIETGRQPELGGKRQEVTVLFTDVANFTDISESMGAEALMLRISEYLEELTGELMRNGATIDKYIGDAIMALWNTPIPEPDHVIHSCRATLLALAANERLNDKWRERGLTPFVTRFGIHTGEAVVGNVGSSDRMNFTAIGATVNVAARLEALNKVYNTRILISETVAGQLDESFLFRSVDIVRPKGVSQPIRIYELIGSRGLGGTNVVLPDVSRLQRWETAFDCYVSRDWQKAVQSFESLLAEAPTDLLAGLHLERSRAYLQSPPGDDWDGIVSYTQK